MLDYYLEPRCVLHHPTATQSCFDIWCLSLTLWCYRVLDGSNNDKCSQISKFICNKNRWNEYKSGQFDAICGDPFREHLSQKWKLRWVVLASEGGMECTPRWEHLRSTFFSRLSFCSKRKCYDSDHKLCYLYTDNIDVKFTFLREFYKFFDAMTM